MFLIASNSLLDRMNDSYDTLQHNTNRLVSKLDLHLTLRALAYMPYRFEMSRHSFDYKKLKNSPRLENAVSLFLEKVPNYRTCEDVHIPSFWCSCMSMIELDAVAYNPNHPQYLQLAEFTPTTPFLNTHLENAIEQINSETYSSIKSYKNSICSKISLKEIRAVFYRKVLGKNNLAYKIEFNINEHQTARFEVYFVIGVSKKITNIREDASEQYVPFPVYYEGMKLGARIMFIKRMDKYGGLCEDIAIANALDPQLCICNSLEHISQYQPNLISSLNTDLHMLFRKTPGISCREVCENIGRYCNDQYFELIHSCKVLRSLASKAWKNLQEIHCSIGDEITLVNYNNTTMIYTKEISYFEGICDQVPLSDSYAACVCE